MNPVPQADAPPIPVGELRRLHAEAWAWAVRRCEGDRTEAEDVLQTAYARVIAGIARYESRAALRTWWFGVIANVAREHRRRRRFRESWFGRWFATGEEGDGAPLPGIPASSADPEREAAEAGERDRLLAALAALPRRQREIVELVFYADLSVDAAAETLGISVGAARAHYHRAKQALAFALGDEGRSGAGGTGDARASAGGRS